MPHYTDAFGTQWTRFSKTQLDSYSGVPISRDRALRCLGEAVAANLAGQSVLEVGCGSGRFTEVLLALGARVISLDRSKAVWANAANIPISPVHQVVQGDTEQLPFLAQFDVVFCLGVIQHTPSPERTIHALWDAVRPGGWLVIDHYSGRWKNSLRIVSVLTRAVVKRLPPSRAMAVTDTLVRWLLPLHRRFDRTAVGHRVLRLLSPVISHYYDFSLTDAEQEEWARLDTYDALTDWYKHRRSIRAIRQLLTTLGAQDISVRSDGIGVEARCRKP
jgi:2-polyprenyl-3-methyl-5-hydroxy-6-metoxy-1,4-benzoquinol methylase